MIGTNDQPIVKHAMSGASPCGSSEAECRACASLPRHRRGEWLAGRRALKLAAAEVLGIPVEELCTATESVIPPRLHRIGADGSSSPIVVKTSLTHRDGQAAATAHVQRRVGIDLERVGSVHPRHARYFLTQQERLDAVHDLTTLWCLKEAAWKALECEGTTPFTALELEFGRHGDLRAVLLDGRSIPAGALLTRSRSGYVLAVVWIEDDAR